MRERFVLFFLLQALDAITTLIFLRQGVVEANPLVRYVIGYWAGFNPIWPILLIKGIGISGSFAFALKFASVDQWKTFLFWSNVLGVLIVTNNIVAMYLA